MGAPPAEKEDLEGARRPHAGRCQSGPSPHSVGPEAGSPWAGQDRVTERRFLSLVLKEMEEGPQLGAAG